MSKTVDFTNAVAGFISSLTFNEEELSATADLVLDTDIPAIKTRRIFVTPQSYERKNDTRASIGRQFKINVAICEKLRKPSDLENRISLAEFVAESLDREVFRVSGMTAIVLNGEFDPIYDITWIRTSRIFLSVYTITLKVLNG